MPAFTGNLRQIHPLLVWWSILFGLSMLSRYHPVASTRVVHVDKSNEATEVQHFLDVSLDAVHDMIERALRAVGPY